MWSSHSKNTIYLNMSSTYICKYTINTSTPNNSFYIGKKNNMSDVKCTKFFILKCCWKYQLWQQHLIDQIRLLLHGCRRFPLAMLQRWTKWLCPQVSPWLQIIITIIIVMDTLSLGLFVLVNHHYNYHYHYQHQYHGHNCPLVNSSFINILFKDRSCSLSSKS